MPASGFQHVQRSLDVQGIGVERIAFAEGNEMVRGEVQDGIGLEFPDRPVAGCEVENVSCQKDGFPGGFLPMVAPATHVVDDQHVVVAPEERVHHCGADEAASARHQSSAHVLPTQRQQVVEEPPVKAGHACAVGARRSCGV